MFISSCVRRGVFEVPYLWPISWFNVLSSLVASREFLELSERLKLRLPRIHGNSFWIAVKISFGLIWVHVIDEGRTTNLAVIITVSEMFVNKFLCWKREVWSPIFVAYLLICCGVKICLFFVWMTYFVVELLSFGLSCVKVCFPFRRPSPSAVPWWWVASS